MQEKEKNKRTEVSTLHARAQKIALGLGAILVAALVLSLFVGKRQPPALFSESDSQIIPTAATRPDFKTRYQASFSDKEKRSSVLKNAPSTEKESLIPSAWQQKETTRVLNTRKVGFGFALSKPESTSSQPNALVDHAMRDSFFTERPFDPKTDHRFLVPISTVLFAATDQAIASDHPGTWIGHLTQDVYSQDHQWILFPKGAKVMGNSFNVQGPNSALSNRLALLVKWLILPNGEQLDLQQTQTQDKSGIGAIAGQVNRHWLWQLSGIGAYALLSTGSHQSAYFPTAQSEGDFSSQFKQGLQQGLQPEVNRYLHIAPNIQIPIGTPIHILLTKACHVKPYRRLNAGID